MKNQEKNPTGTCKAAPISDALHNKLLASMMQAKAELKDEERIETMLQRLAPAPLSGAAQHRIQESVLRAQQSTHSPYKLEKRSHFPLRKLAALIVLFCICLGVISQYLMLNLDPESNESVSMGLASRRVFNVRPVNEAKWLGQQARGEYEVLYEDSFVYSDEDDGMTIIVTVPNRTTVSMEVNSI
ncbi:MAG: hypothetical protein R3Y56_08015 [Akkermansia sp.]